MQLDLFSTPHLENFCLVDILPVYIIKRAHELVKQIVVVSSNESVIKDIFEQRMVQVDDLPGHNGQLFP